MVSSTEPPQIQTAVVGAKRNVATSFVGQLDSGELLTGAATVVEVTTTDLTIANEQVSTGTLTINERTVLAGQAVQFTVSGHLVANTPYSIKITVGTDATAAQTLITHLTLNVVAA